MASRATACWSHRARRKLGGSAGGGATRNGEPLAASRQLGLEGARVPTDNAARWLPGVVRVAKPNSIALRMAMVAAGEADFVATIGQGHEWDIAAAQLIATEAGAIVTTSMALRSPIIRGQRGVRHARCRPGVHAEALTVIKAMAGTRSRESR